MNAKLEQRPPTAAEPKKKAGGVGYPVFVGIAIALGLLAIVSTSFSGGQYALTIADLSEDMAGKDVRINGKIKASTTNMVERNNQMELHFTLTDGNGNDVRVVYPHNPPDPYKEGRDAIVEGKVQDDGHIRASKLTVKCPSKYQKEGGTMDPAKFEEYRKKYGSGAATTSGSPSSSGGY